MHGMRRSLHEQEMLVLPRCPPIRLEDQEIEGVEDMNVCAECGQVHAMDPKHIEQCISCLKKKNRNPNCARLVKCMKGQDLTSNTIREEMESMKVLP